MSNQNYEQLTNKQLKEELRRRGLPISGGKPVLLERLAAADAPSAPPAEPAELNPVVPVVAAPKGFNPGTASLDEIVLRINLDAKLPNGKVVPVVRVKKPAKGSKAETQLRFWAGQPKVRIILPLGFKETRGVAYQPANVNGLHADVYKGFYVSLPEQLAELYQDSHNQTAEAQSQFLAENAQGDETAQKLGIGAQALNE